MEVREPYFMHKGIVRRWRYEPLVEPILELIKEHKELTRKQIARLLLEKGNEFSNGDLESCMRHLESQLEVAKKPDPEPMEVKHYSIKS